MTFHYGGFWRRCAAISIDSIILDLFAVIVYLIGNTLIPVDDGFTPSMVVPYYGMAILLNAVYFIYFHGTSGQTPGKRLFGLRVVQTDGTPLTPGIAFLRWVGYLISKIPLFLGFVWAAFDARKQGWHDKIAGTCVIRTIEYRRDSDRLLADAHRGPDRDSPSGGGGFPHDGGEYGLPEEDGSMVKRLDKGIEIG